MKKIGLIIMVFVTMALLLPNIGQCYTISVNQYSATGGRSVMEQYNSSAPTQLISRTEYGNGIATITRKYGLNDAEIETVRYNYAGTLLTSTTTTNDVGLDFESYYDASGQMSHEIWLQVFNTATADPNDIINVNGSVNLSIALGDTIGAHPDFPNLPNDDPTTTVNEHTQAQQQALNDLNAMRAIGNLLINSGFVNMTSGLYNTSSGLDGRSATGALIKSISLDRNGDGVRETTANFAVSSLPFAAGGGRYVLYATGVEQLNAGGQEGIVNIPGLSTNGTVSGIADPKTFTSHAAMDPAVTISGVLGQDTNGFFVTDADGNRHNLTLGDSFWNNELSANIGRNVTVSGDTQDNNATNIDLQELVV